MGMGEEAREVCRSFGAGGGGLREARQGKGGGVRRKETACLLAQPLDSLRVVVARVAARRCAWPFTAPTERDDTPAR